MTEFRWQTLANCKGQTHIFFPPHKEREAARMVREAEARDMCANCKVRYPCAEASVDEEGIWAGLNDEERKFALSN